MQTVKKQFKYRSHCNNACMLSSFVFPPEISNEMIQFQFQSPTQQIKKEIAKLQPITFGSWRN